jgi:hypothetical protein
MSNTEEKRVSTENDLATTKDGFVAGAIFAVLLLLGFIKIVALNEAFAIWILLALAAYTTYYNVSHKRSLTSYPAWDGFILGFGWIFGIVSLVLTIPH